MAMDFSEAVLNAMLDSVETTVGASPVLRILDGTMPAGVGDADAGTVLVEMALPSDAFAAASGANKAKSGTWSDTSANASGDETGYYFRIYANGGTTCHIQGTVTATGGGGDMEIDNMDINAGQTVTVTAFTLSAEGV